MSFSLLLQAGGLRAECILDLPFDDPKGMIHKSDGILRADDAFSSKKATLSSGSGGRVLPGFNEGPEGAGVDKKGKPTSEARMFSMKDLGMEGAPYLHLTLSADPLITRSVAVRVLPDTPEHSLSALFRFEDGRGRIDGALDFFFKASSDEGAYPKVALWGNCGPLALNMFSDPDRGRFVLRITTDKDQQSIDSDGDGKADRDNVSGMSGKDVVLKSGVLYHAALVFRTSPEGLIRMDFCLQEGLGSMNTEETVVASIKNFAVLNGDFRVGEDEKDVLSLALGKTKVAQTLDLAGARIYNAIPDRLPGIKGP